MPKLKRVYDKPLPGDGFRILVERLWPRGIRKEDARIDLWFKEIAPSSELRKWYGHRPEHWEEFKRLYRKELEGKSGLIAELVQHCRKEKTVTFVFAARDEKHNSAVVLNKIIEEALKN